MDADCTPKLPTTTPTNCAIAKCDPLQHVCQFLAKDEDQDGHRRKQCSAASGKIETGDDCDDVDPSTHPGAWDGPATATETDRCDQKDNDCNGSEDDGKISVDGGAAKSCACDPLKPPSCYEYAGGAPIDPGTLDTNNQPKGACRKGARACTNGVAGSCIGAIGPQPEVCDATDRDCNGISGNAGDFVAGAPTHCKDEDGDTFCTAACTQACVSPAGYRLQATCGSGVDCNDSASGGGTV